VKQFSPTPPRQPGPPTPPRRVERRLLDELPSLTVLPKQPASNPVAAYRFNPVVATVYTEEGRTSVPDNFLNCCRLLVHHAPHKQLFDMKYNTPLAPTDLLFVREPCRLFRIEILAPLAKLAVSSGFMAPFQSLMETILHTVQINLLSVYDPHFFSAGFLHSILSVESWMVSDHIHPRNAPATTFHVYRLVSSLQTYTGHPLLLPSNGLSLLEAKQIGILTYYTFAMMDIEPDFLSEKFSGSVLGTRLKAWSALPDNATIHAIWNKHPRAATYHWFQSLQSILWTMQSWIKRLRYHPTRGFVHSQDSSSARHLLLHSHMPSNIPGRMDTLIGAFGNVDMLFENRWYRSTAHDSSWTDPIPSGYFQSSPTFPTSGRPPPSNFNRPPPEPETDQNGRRIRRQLLGGRRERGPPDFTNTTPVMEAVTSLPNTTSVTGILVKRMSQPTVVFPRFPSATGTSQTLCLSSAFASPHHCCTTSYCGERTRTPTTPRLHIDLSRDHDQ
jgi:hypothetical protein